jgi:RNA polymerase sigma-70 factor (ECF subfamily)
MRGELEPFATSDAADDFRQPDSSLMPETKSDAHGNTHSEAVVRLFSQHQRWLFGYLVSLLGNPNDAEDVMQEVSVVLWKDQHKFELGTNFTAWLGVIAYHQVQKFWRNRKRDQIVLSPDIVEQLAALPEDFELMENRRRVLSDCVSQLRDPDRILVRRFYGERKITAKKLAEELGRPAGTVYKAMNRVRRTLLDCVDRKLKAEGVA